MRNELADDDRKLIDILVKHCGLLEIEALIFVLMTTKQIARSITVPRLIEVLKLYHYYDKFPSDADINKGIKGLIEKEMLSLVKIDQQEMVSCLDPRDTIKHRWKTNQNSEFENAISILTEKIKAMEEGAIHLLGPATSSEAKSTFFEALDSAKTEIKLPVFSTRSHGTLRDALERALSRGVYVKLLMYSPKSAALTYGGDYDKELVMMTNLWRLEMSELNKRGPGKILIRTIEDLNHLHFSGGLIIDRKQFRYGVRYPGLQRGHEAIIVTGQSLDDEPSNLLMLLDYYFDIAWSKARPIDWPRRMLHIVTFRKLPH